MCVPSRQKFQKLPTTQVWTVFGGGISGCLWCLCHSCFIYNSQVWAADGTGSAFLQATAAIWMFWAVELTAILLASSLVYASSNPNPLSASSRICQLTCSLCLHSLPRGGRREKSADTLALPLNWWCNWESWERHPFTFVNLLSTILGNR